VTRKTKQLEVEGDVPQCPITGDANAYHITSHRSP